MGRTSLWRSVERDAKASGKRHLGDRNQQPAVRDIVHGGDAARADQAAHEIAGAPLGSEIDRRRGAFVSSARKLLIERLAEMASLRPDEDQRIAVLLQRRCVAISAMSGMSPMPPMAGVGGMATPFVSL